MSIKNDVGLIDKFRELQDVGSMLVKINHDQITEIVVADLMRKYKACAERNDEFKEAFEKVLRFYLDEDEFNEMLGIIEQPRGLTEFTDVLDAIDNAISEYYEALDNRQHGGVAKDKALSKIENVLGRRWQQKTPKS